MIGGRHFSIRSVCDLRRGVGGSFGRIEKGEEDILFCFVGKVGLLKEVKRC